MARYNLDFLTTIPPEYCPIRYRDSIRSLLGYAAMRFSEILASLLGYPALRNTFSLEGNSGS